MPAGKMYLAAKARRPRRASNFKKAVTAIAKKATMRLAEHKYAVGTNTANLGANGLLIPMYANVTQGDTQNSRDGDQIRSTGVTIRGFIQQDPTIITARQSDNAVRMLICSGKRPLTTGDMPGYKDAIDKETLNVISDRYVQFSSTKTTNWFVKYVKYQRVIPFQGTGVNKNELYLWLVPYGGTGLTTTAGNYINLNYHLGFKDI